MRKIPLIGAAFIGREVKHSKTLATVYIVGVFLAVPAIMLGLSALGTAAVIVGFVVIFAGISKYKWVRETDVNVKFFVEGIRGSPLFM